jgi:hypothetical protein
MTVNGEPVADDSKQMADAEPHESAQEFSDEAAAALAREQRRAQAIGQGIADALKGLWNIGLFALAYLVLHELLDIDREWALVAAAVFTLSEARPW